MQVCMCVWMYALSSLVYNLLVQNLLRASYSNSREQWTILSTALLRTLPKLSTFFPEIHRIHPYIHIYIRCQDTCSMWGQQPTDGMYVCGFQGTDIAAMRTIHLDIIIRWFLHKTVDCFSHTYIHTSMDAVGEISKSGPLNGMPGFYGIDCISTCNTYIHIQAYITCTH